LKKIVDWAKAEIHKLMELPDRPHAVAMGVACGVFVGFTPLVGIKTILAFILAIFMRGNRLAAVVVVNLHDVLLPLAPFFVYIQYQLGGFLMGRVHHQSRLTEIVWPPWEEWFSVATIKSVCTLYNLKIILNEGMPLLLGSVIVGLAVAPISYYITLRALQKAQARRAERKHEQEAKHDAKV